MAEELSAPSNEEVMILRAAAEGDDDAARLLLDEYFPTVYGFVFARLGGNEDASADVLQETVIEAMKSARSFRGESQLTTWLCTIARRRLARHLEQERREAVKAAGLQLVSSGESDVAAQDEVVRALGKLSALPGKYLF